MRNMRSSCRAYRCRFTPLTAWIITFPNQSGAVPPLCAAGNAGTFKAATTSCVTIQTRPGRGLSLVLDEVGGGGDLVIKTARRCVGRPGEPVDLIRAPC